MTTKAGVGMSHHHSPSIAGHEAAEKALENAGLSKPDFVFIFVRWGMISVLCCMRCERPLKAHPSVDARGKVRSAETTQTNRTTLWLLWLSLRTSYGGTTA